MPQKMLGGFSSASTVGDSYGVMLGIFQDLVASNDMDTRWDHACECVVPAIGRGYHKTVDLTANQGLNLRPLQLNIASGTCEDHCVSTLSRYVLETVYGVRGKWI